jgi:hypothetical protein
MTDYAKQKFAQAVTALVGSEDIDKRLTYAAACLKTIHARDIPEALKDEFAEIERALFTTPLSREWNYQDRQISTADGMLLARRIVSFFVEIMGGL